MTIRDGYTLVYLPFGAKVAHMLAPNVSPNDYSRAICGREPTWPTLWSGTGNQTEWETARSVPLCVGCKAAYGRK